MEQTFNYFVSYYQHTNDNSVSFGSAIVEMENKIQCKEDVIEMKDLLIKEVGYMPLTIINFILLNQE